MKNKKYIKSLKVVKVEIYNNGDHKIINWTMSKTKQICKESYGI